MRDNDLHKEYPIRLSICMPTYNFGEYIASTLDSILCQIKSDMEIIIVDGGSSDNTQEIIKTYQKSHPQIIYHCLSVRGGIDKDMALSVALARGEFCWLFSSDDIMQAGAIDKIYQEINAGHDIYICSFTIHSLDFQKFICKHPIFNRTADQVYDLRKISDRNLFFQEGMTTTAFFSFMSSLIIKRKTWNSAKNVDEFDGSCWAHVARFFSIYPDLSIKYLSSAYLKKRDGNDSFLTHGLIYRIGISIYGFNRIADKFLGHSSEAAFHVRRVLRKEFSSYLMLNLKNNASTKNEKREVKILSKLLFSDLTLECLNSKAMIFYKSLFIYRIASRAYRKLRSIMAGNKLKTKVG